MLGRGYVGLFDLLVRLGMHPPSDERIANLTGLELRGERGPGMSPAGAIDADGATRWKEQPCLKGRRGLRHPEYTSTLEPTRPWTPIPLAYRWLFTVIYTTSATTSSAYPHERVTPPPPWP